MTKGRITCLIVVIGLWITGLTGTNYNESYVCNEDDCYFLVKLNKTQSRAESCCRSANGHLAVINSTEDEQLLLQLVSQHPGDDKVWIGAQIERKLWHWENGGEFLFRQGCRTIKTPQGVCLNGTDITLARCLAFCDNESYPLASMGNIKENEVSNFSCCCNTIEEVTDWKIASKDEECDKPCLDEKHESCGGRQPHVRYLYAINGTRVGYWLRDFCKVTKNCRPPGGFSGHESGPPSDGRPGNQRSRGGPGGDFPPPPDMPQPFKRNPPRQSPIPPDVAEFCAGVRLDISSHVPIGFVGNQCDKKLQFICQYTPEHNNTCNRKDLWLPDMGICVFKSRPGMTKENPCEKMNPTSYPIELTHPSLLSNKGNIVEITRKLKIPAERNYWTGLQKCKVTWPVGTITDNTYTNWDEYQPEIDDTKNCVAVGKSKLFWYSWDCYRPKHFICQIPKSSAEQAKNICRVRGPSNIVEPTNINMVEHKNKKSTKAPFPSLEVGVATMVILVVVILFTTTCACVFKRRATVTKNAKDASITDAAGSENTAYGTLPSSETFKEEIYDEINENVITDYTSLNEVRYGAPPNDERYKRLTSSSEHSENDAGSTTELTKHEMKPALESFEGPVLPPRDNQYAGLKQVLPPQEQPEEESEQENSEAEHTAEEKYISQDGAVSDDAPPSESDNNHKMSSEGQPQKEQLSQKEVELTELPSSDVPTDISEQDEMEKENDYLKIIG